VYNSSSWAAVVEEVKVERHRVIVMVIVAVHDVVAVRIVHLAAMNMTRSLW